MTAREMFEELGYTYKESKYKGELVSILYDDDYKFASKIKFDLEGGMIKVYCLNDTAGYFDVTILKAINKQIEELGWNNE